MAMRALSMKSEEEFRRASITTYPPFHGKIVVAAFSIFLASQALSQTLDSSTTPDLVPEIELVDITEIVSEFEFGAYDYRLIEPLQDIATQLQQTGDHAQALEIFYQAWHVDRINNGLYSESQIQLLNKLIESNAALRQWSEVDSYYSYMEHLYRRLYRVDDPRLELGLQRVVSWHVNALNINLDGRRIEHLQQASKLFKLRLQIAELTLTADDPKFDFLIQNIVICERQLYLASDLNREMYRRQQRSRQNALVTDRD